VKIEILSLPKAYTIDCIPFANARQAARESTDEATVSPIGGISPVKEIVANVLVSGIIVSSGTEKNKSTTIAPDMGLPSKRTRESPLSIGDFRSNPEDKRRNKQVCGYFIDEAPIPFFS
jgi:hypothetical protein